MKFVLKYLDKYKTVSLLAPLFKMLEAIFELFVPLVMADLINKGIGNLDKNYVLKCCGLLVLLAIVGLAFAVTAQYFSAKAAIGASSQMRSDLFKKILSFSPEQKEKIGTDALTTRITSDINQIQNGINMVLRLFLRSPFIVAGAVIMAFTVDVKSALIFVVVVPILSVIVFFIMRYTLPKYKQIQVKLEEVLYTVGENIEGSRVIRAFVQQDDEIDDFEKKTKSLSDLQTKTGSVAAFLNPITYVIVNMGAVAILYVAGQQVNSGILLKGEVVAQVNYMGQILVELIKLANLIVLLMKAFPSALRVQEIMEMDSDERIFNSSNACITESDIKTGLSISVKDLDFTYANAQENSLESISFDIPAGSVFGIIGGTGSGKSTLLRLLYHDYQVTKGSITINGKKVEDYSLSEISDIFGIVPQHATLFAGTLRENMTMKGPASDEELIEALKCAQAFDFISQKEGVLDTPIERGGRNFSGGQRQRLTIARALVKKPSIIILDDSASALDLLTESKLRKALLSLDWNPTIIIVSQRASSVKSADQILVLEDGHCAGLGTHEELMASCDIYNEIYYCQYPEDDVAGGAL